MSFKNNEALTANKTHLSTHYDQQSRLYFKSFQRTAETSHKRFHSETNLLLALADWVDFCGLPCQAGLAELIPVSSGEPRFMLPVLPPCAVALSCMLSANSPANHQQHEISYSNIRNR